MKTRIILLTAIHVFVTLISNAQGNLVWAKKMGAGGNEGGVSVAVDAAGNIYTTGWFNGTVDFDPGPGVFYLASVGVEDIFISKLDPSGAFLWAKRIGGQNYDNGNSVALDSNSNVYVTGFFSGTVDFDPGNAGYFLSSSGNDDIFVLKLDASGNFIWAKNMGGAAYAYGASIAVDATGNVYTTGYYGGTTDFDPGPGVFNLTPAGPQGIFISKLNSSGAFTWARSMGGTNGDRGTSIGVDAANDVYLAGAFNDTVDFDPGTGTYTLASAGFQDGFVSKFDASGALIWAKTMGGQGYDFVSCVAVDPSSNVYILGYFSGTSDFDPSISSYTMTSAGLGDVFVSKLNSSGTFIFAKSFGGSDNDIGNALDIDPSGNIYITGNYNSTADFDPGTTVYNLTALGVSDIFISKLDAAGSFAWAKSIGGTTDDNGCSIAVDAAHNVYVTGYFTTTADFDPAPATYNLTSAGGGDIFVLKLSDAVSGLDERTSTNYATIFPNPGKGLFQLKLDNEIADCQLILINSSGQKVHEQKIVQGINSMNTSGLSNGLYHFILFSNKQKISDGKLVVE